MSQTSGEVQILLWVSQEALAAEEAPAGFPADLWGVVESARASFRRFVSNLSMLGPGPCLPLPRGEPIVMPPGSEQRPRVHPDFVASAADAELVALAEVRAVEPGLDGFQGSRILTRIRVAVSEVLRDEGGNVAPGDQFVYLSPGGRLSFDGVSLCGDEFPGHPIPEPGATVLLTAFSGPDPSGFFHPWTESAVHDGTVEVPSGSVFGAHDIPLDEIRSALARPYGEAPP